VTLQITYGPTTPPGLRQARQQPQDHSNSASLSSTGLSTDKTSRGSSQDENCRSTATSGNMPLSPSTERTSIDSKDADIDTSKLVSGSSRVTPSTTSTSTAKSSVEHMNENKGATAIVRPLKKKPSR